MIKVKVEGIEQLTRDLMTMMVRHRPLFAKMLRHIGRTVQRTAVANAPKSPTKGQYAATLKGKRKSKASNMRFNPGGLERSIVFAVRENAFAVDVYVPVNSEAGKYAYKMHESHYDLGPGSEAKQKQQGRTIGREYLTRALDEEGPNITASIQSYVDEMAEKENRS